jgi:hypothetical protein
MNTRTTWMLLVCAALLGGWIWFQDRPSPRSVPAASGPAARFPLIEPSTLTAVELMRSNVLIRVERIAGRWEMKLPVAYAAQSAAVDSFLEAIAKLAPNSYIRSHEFSDQSDALRAFGLDASAAVVTLLGRNTPLILKLGAHAPLGSQFYLQRVGDDGVYTADAEFLSRLPKSPDDWRDRALLQLPDTSYDRMEVRGSTGFEAVKDAGTGDWRLTKPLSTRADGDRLEALLNQLRSAKVAAFVADAPLVDAEAYGLQPPDAELTVGRGTNDLAQLQFGGAATNAPGLIFVRRSTQTNVVLVPAETVTLLKLPLAAYRDRRLLPGLIVANRLEFTTGTGRATLQREGTNWFVVAPERFPADPDMMRLLFEHAARLEIAEFSADVVSDPARYGLDQPAREFIWWQTVTNVGGIVTNRLVADVQFSLLPTNSPTLSYARRVDEPGVYKIPRADVYRLPETANQLRDWRFAATNVSKVIIHQAGRDRELTRQASGAWAATAGAAGIVVPDSIEETLLRLGRLTSLRYAIRDEKTLLNGAKFDIRAHEIELRFREGSGPLRRWRLRFGGDLANSVITLANFDDDPVPLRVEVPRKLYEDVVRDFSAG